MGLSSVFYIKTNIFKTESVAIVKKIIVVTERFNMKYQYGKKRTVERSSYRFFSAALNSSVYS